MDTPRMLTYSEWAKQLARYQMKTLERYLDDAGLDHPPWVGKALNPTAHWREEAIRLLCLDALAKGQLAVDPTKWDPTK